MMARASASSERIPTVSWALWLVGLFAYTIAILQRTSMGVAGMEAAERFSTSASVLGTFVLVQLGVYASLQIPVGVLVDRVGPRRLILAGALIMAVGQFMLAQSEQLSMAIIARMLVGTGDAMTFVSVIRLLPLWFPERRVPLMVQLTGIVGQSGQILSAIPFAGLLHAGGWEMAFSAAAAASILALTVVLVAMPSRYAELPEPPVAAGGVLDSLKAAWRHPGTRLGLWTHFLTPFPAASFVMLWGVPFLVSAQGLSRGTASTLLTVHVATAMVAAPIVGELVSRFPRQRSWITLTVLVTAVLPWTAILVRSEPAPLWLLVTLVMGIALGGPASVMGFDYARTYNPPHRIGTATGIVNVGGFVATILTVQAVGVVLDLTGSGTSFEWSGFRWAMTVQYPLWTVGLIGVMRARRQVRALRT